MLDLDHDDTQRALADAAAAWCRDHCTPDDVRACAGRFPDVLWRGLAELGFLGLGTPAGEGGALELAAVLESLGAAAFPGPVAAATLAACVLPPEEAARIASGDAIPCVGAAPLWPWAPVAHVLVETDGVRCWRVRAGELEEIATLGGERWGRGACERVEALPAGPRAFALHHVALGALLAGAGRRLLEAAAEHAATRRQFGRAIGEFQAVAHPLADRAMALDAARGLVRAAAWRLDDAADRGAPDDADPVRLAAVARCSARGAALETAHVAHQVFGAVGVTLDGPAWFLSRRIRQLASARPAAAPEEALALVLAGGGALADAGRRALVAGAPA